MTFRKDLNEFRKNADMNISLKEIEDKINELILKYNEIRDPRKILVRFVTDGWPKFQVAYFQLTGRESP